MRRMMLALGSLLVVAGCGGGGETTGPGPVRPAPVTAASVVVSSPDSLNVGATASAVATVTGSDGQPFSGAVTWTTSNASVASVTSQGVVTAVSAGTDTLSASVGAKTGTKIFRVVNSGKPGSLAGVAVSLSVGQTMTYPGSTTLVLPGGAEYSVIVANTNSAPDAKGSYALSVDSANWSARLSPRGNLIPSRSMNAPGRSSMDMQNAMDARLGEYARHSLTGRQGYGSAIRASLSMNVPLRRSVMTVGSVVPIKVPAATGDPCTGYTTAQATVVAVSNRAIILADTTSPTGGFTTADYQAIATEFDNIIYQTDTKYFGTPSDIDGNGKVEILFTPEVNKQTPAGSVGYVGGFFFAGDLYPTASCAQSNVGEIFYLLAPDPTGKFGVAHSADAVRQASRGTVAHEFEHMINSGYKLAKGAGFEDVWLDEALAHFAEDAVGRAQNGQGDLQRLTDGDVHNNANNYSAFFFQNAARMGMYLGAAGSTGVNSGQVATSLAARGAAWSFLRYAADQYSGGNPAELTTALVQSSVAGVANLTAKTGVSYQTLVTGWLASNVLDGVATVAPIGYASYAMRSFVSGAGMGGYPLLSNNVGSSAVSMSGTVTSGDGVYYDVQAPTGRRVRVLDATGSPSSFSGSTLVVARIK